MTTNCNTLNTTSRTTSWVSWLASAGRRFFFRVADALIGLRKDEDTPVQPNDFNLPDNQRTYLSIHHLWL